MRKKRMYELTEKELEKYYFHPLVQELVKFVDSYNKPCETLFDSYLSCIKFKLLLEQEFEVE